MKMRTRIVLLLTATLIVIVGAVSFIYAEDTGSGENSGSAGDSVSGDDSGSAVNTGYGEYEVYDDGNAVLYNWIPTPGVTEVTVPETVEVDGVTATVVDITSAAFDNSPDIQVLHLPRTLQFTDTMLLEDTNVTSVNIPPELSGRGILDGSKVSEVTFDEGREELPSDLLYSPLEADKQWDFIYFDDGAKYWSDDYGTGTGRDALEKVHFNSDLYEISDQVFCWCANLKTADGLVDAKVIGSDAFAYCESLTSITIPTPWISEGAFMLCSKLKDIEFLTDYIYAGKGAFFYCSSIDSFTADIVSLGEHAFSRASVSDPNGLTVGDINIPSEAFHNCKVSKITMLTDPSLTASLTIGDGAFSGCTAQEVILSPHVTTLQGAAFLGADITSIDLSNITSIGMGAFSSSSLTGEIRVPAVDIPELAFENCRSLESVKFFYPAGTPRQYTIGKSAFAGCSNLREIDLLEGLTNIATDSFHSTGLTSIVFPSTLTNLGSESFELCEDLKTVEFRSGITEIPAEAFREAGMEKVIFPDTLKKIGEFAFADCKNLHELVFKGSIEKIGANAFRNSALTELNLPAVTDSLGFAAFEGCTSLRKVTMSYCSRMGASAFNGCTNIEELTLPKGLKEIPNAAFAECISISSLEIPEGVRTIGPRAFYNCIGLASLKLSDSVLHIEDHAFAICQRLAEINFGSGLVSIGPSAFEFCNKALKKVDIPASTTAIGAFAFANCDCLSEINIAGNSVLIDGGAFYSTDISDFTVRKGYSFGTARHTMLATTTVHTVSGTMSDANRILDNSINDIEIGSLGGSDISHLIFEEDVKSVEDNLYDCPEPDNKSLEVDFPAAGISIGSNAFHNAGTAGLTLNFLAGPPSKIAEDAFSTDDRDNTRMGLGKYTDDSERWESISHTDYGRSIWWGSQVGYDGEIAWAISREGTLYVMGSGKYPADIPDYESPKQRPWGTSNTIEKIVVENKIQVIGTHAFDELESLRSVRIKSEVTDIHSAAIGNRVNSIVIEFSKSHPEFSTDAFSGVSEAICYYPASDMTWYSVDNLAAEQGNSRFNYGGNKVCWIEDKGFKLRRDNNYMGNNLNIFKDRHSKYEVLLDVNMMRGKDLLGLLVIKVMKANTNITDTSTEGVCFGLAATMMLHQQHKLDHVFDSDTPYYELNINSQAYKDVVNYYYLLQKATRIANPEITIGKRLSKNQLGKFVDLVKTRTDAGGTVMLSYKMKDSSHDHIALCCGYRYGDFDDSGEEEYAIRMYDCNAENSFSYMYVDKDYEWFSYTNPADIKIEDSYKELDIYTVESFDVGKVRLPKDEDSIAQTKPVKRTSTNSGTRSVENEEETPAASEYAKVLVTTSRPFTLTNAEGQILKFDGEEYSGDMTLYDTFSVMYSNDEILTLDPSDSFTVTGFDGEFTFMAEVGGTAYSAELSQAEKVSISSDGVHVTGKDGAPATYQMATLTGGDNLTYTQISGTAGGDMTFAANDDGLAFSATGSIEEMHILTDASGEVKERELTEKELGNIESQVVITSGENGEITTNVDEEEITPVLVRKITLSGISKKIAAGRSIQLKASVSPSNADNKKLKWTSSNTRIATVTQSGKVTLKKNTGGKSVTITAAAQDVSGIKATYKITSMKSAVTKLSVKGAKKTLKAGKTMKLQAKVTAKKGANTKVQWTSSNKKYATVSSSGKVKALKAGKGKTVKITCMTTDGTNRKKVIKIKIK